MWQPRMRSVAAWSGRNNARGGRWCWSTLPQTRPACRRQSRPGMLVLASPQKAWVMLHLTRGVRATAFPQALGRGSSPPLGRNSARLWLAPKGAGGPASSPCPSCRQQYVHGLPGLGQAAPVPTRAEQPLPSRGPASVNDAAAAGGRQQGTQDRPAARHPTREVPLGVAARRERARRAKAAAPRGPRAAFRLRPANRRRPRYRQLPRGPLPLRICARRARPPPVQRLGGHPQPVQATLPMRLHPQCGVSGREA